MSCEASSNQSVNFFLYVIAFLETLIIAVLLLQKCTNHTNLLNDDQMRGTSRIRRQTSIDDAGSTVPISPSLLYVPLYAKLSDKSLKAICDKHRKYQKKKKTNEKWNRTKNLRNSSSNRIRRLNNRDCGLISSISQPQILAHRLNKIGGIIRHATRWFQARKYSTTEYSLGYNVFEYRNLSELRYSRPFAVHSLDNAQFDGTDNTVCDGNTFIYYSVATSRIYAYKMGEQNSKSVEIDAAKTPIYQFSHSYVDLESNSRHFWIMYHSSTDNILRVSLRDCSSLVDYKSWNLKFLNSSVLMNAFIACNHLYTITYNATSLILNVVYDFNTDRIIQKYPEIGSWKRYGSPSTVHYDYLSKTINVFDDGIIQSIAVKML